MERDQYRAAVIAALEGYAREERPYRFRSDGDEAALTITFTLDDPAAYHAGLREIMAATGPPTITVIRLAS